MADEELIGIVGGMGPAAGVRFARLLTDAVSAEDDQGHPSFVLLSAPRRIGDRTAYLLQRNAALRGDAEPILANPGLAIRDQVRTLVDLGATKIAIPCNTAHAEVILAPTIQMLSSEAPHAHLHHLIDITVAHLAEQHAGSTVGVLSTDGTRICDVYRRPLLARGLQPVVPDDELQRKVDDIIRAIKTGSRDAEPLRSIVENDLRKKLGVEVVILGCTELPIVFDEEHPEIIDPLRLLASHLIST